jgi:methylated-DNA-protein-cysteine methyltransferase-like protein
MEEGLGHLTLFSAVYAAVRRIPRGKVATYGQVAEAAGVPGAARQVVWALRAGRNLPWHRVLGAGGRIRLPGEAGLEQRLRLETEGVRVVNGRVPLEKHGYRFRETCQGKVETSGSEQSRKFRF